MSPSNNYILTWWSLWCLVNQPTNDIHQRMYVVCFASCWPAALQSLYQHSCIWLKRLTAMAYFVSFLCVHMQAKYAHHDGSNCLTKFSKMNIPAAAPGTQDSGQVDTFTVMFLLLPKTGRCSDLRNVCLPARDGSMCQVALADKQYSVCPMYTATYKP